MGTPHKTRDITSINFTLFSEGELSILYDISMIYYYTLYFL